MHGHANDSIVEGLLQHVYGYDQRLTHALTSTAAAHQHLREAMDKQLANGVLGAIQRGLCLKFALMRAEVSCVRGWQMQLPAHPQG